MWNTFNDVGVVVVISSIVGALSIRSVLEEFSRWKYSHAEIINLNSAAQQYRKLYGSYEGISIRKLRDRGFGLVSFTDGKGENVYGRDMVIRSAGAKHGQADVIYEFDDDEDCQWVLLSSTIPDGPGEPTCYGEVLRYTLE